MNWTEKDRETFEARGIDVDEAERQLEMLRRPPKSLELVRPATAGDGIRIVRESEVRELAERADEAASRGRITKFVPASGAATRMFGALTPALDPDRSLAGAPNRFLEGWKKFPFSGELEVLAEQRSLDLEGELSDSEKREFLRLLLTDEGLDYAHLAKGLIIFHRYDGHTRTAFEEQLREGLHFASDGNRARFHFTVPREDRGKFSTEANRLKKEIRKDRGIEPEVTFSVQHPSTDTVAVDSDGDPFRKNGRELLFRPGGHGALLRNLDELEGDLVFIKNIDNIRREAAHREVARSYRVLIGYVAKLEELVFSALRSVESGNEAAIRRANALASEQFARGWKGDHEDLDGMKTHVVGALSRPIRACAVVKNEGEPGGAPFWVRGPNGQLSLQIVESSQIDVSDAKQRKIFGSSTHFNPVAIAVAVRDVNGEPYELRRFVDPDAAFVSQKNHDGRELRALEHPGLWNGGMAKWNTVFVELPAMTFAPVKTVFDLLRVEHLQDGDSM